MIDCLAGSVPTGTKAKTYMVLNCGGSKKSYKRSAGNVAFIKSVSSEYCRIIKTSDVPLIRHSIPVIDEASF